MRRENREQRAENREQRAESKEKREEHGLLGLNMAGNVQDKYLKKMFFGS